MKNILILNHVALMVASMPSSRRPQLCLDYDAVDGSGACETNVNGLKEGILFNSRKNITAYPTAIAATSSKDLGILDGAYSCTSGSEFQTLNIDHEVSDVKLEGTAPGVGPFKVTANLFVRGSKEEVEGFAAQAQYDKMVFILPQSDGVRRVIGNADYPARVKAMFDTKNTESTDPRGWQFEISSKSVYPERLKSTATVPTI